MQEIDRRHGGPFDRGTADSYYQRQLSPHYFVDATYSSDKVGIEDMTAEEIAEYTKGYNENEAAGNFKEW
jgi:hypothetical protein|tara:strand:+ start:832 stop:1041 length:210 start_codon:yes stop_codon:yes gene_type:complete